jgi:hypothetical protein
MASRRSTLHRPDEQFIALANTIYTQCLEHAEAWAIDPQQLATCASLLAAATTAYEASLKRATRTMATTAVKRSAFMALRRFLSRFIDYLEGNVAVPDTAIATMGLRPRTRTLRQPLSRPTEAPGLVVTRLHGQLNVHAIRPSHGHLSSNVIGDRYYGFMLRYKKEGDTDFHIVVSTRMRRILQFEQADEGKRISLSAAWINPRLEPGPWSEEIMESIS